MENESAIESNAEATAPEPQEAQDAQSAEVETPEPAQAEAKPQVSATERLKELVKKSKDPEKANSLTDEELDFLEKHDFGNKPPKEDKKQTPKKEEKEAKEESAASPLADVLKELGAKDENDILPKVKELRKALTGKDAQTAVRLQKDLDSVMGRVRNEAKLWEDVRSGNPEAVQKALAFVEKAYGVKLVPASQQQQQAPVLNGEGLIPRDKFLDPDFADAVNSLIGGFKSELDSVKKSLKEDSDRRAAETAKEQATSAAVDEMVTLAGKKGLEEIAKIPNLRQSIKDWYQGKDDPRFEIFDKIIDLANRRNVDMEMAWAYLRANESDIEIAKAKQEGRAEAYNQRPSKTLSGIQGKGQAEYTNYTDAQFEEMSRDPRKVPEEWFNEKDQLDPKRVPKRGHKWLFPSEAKGE